MAHPPGDLSQDLDSSSVSVSCPEKDLNDVLVPIIRQQLDQWFDRRHQRFQQKVMQLLEELSSRVTAAPELDAKPAKSHSEVDCTTCPNSDSTRSYPTMPSSSHSEPRLPAPEKDVLFRKAASMQGFRLSVVPPTPPVQPAKTAPTPHLGAPAVLPHVTDDNLEELGGSLCTSSPRQSRASTRRGSNMKIIDRASHVCILASQTHSQSSMEEQPFQHDIGYRLVLKVRSRMVSVMLTLLTLIAIVPLLALHSHGNNFSASYAFLVASNAIYTFAAICCSALLRMALLSEDLELAFSKLTRFVGGQLGQQWKSLSRQERWKYVIAWTVLNAGFAATWSVDVYLAVSRCREASVQEDYRGELIFVASSIMSFLSFATASALILTVAYVHSNLLLALDEILDCWVADVVNTSDFVKGVTSWNSIQALLKSASRELASSFLLLQALGVIGLVVFLTGSLTFIWRTDVEPYLLAIEGSSALPLICLFLVGTRLCFHGAALTEKCRNIPALVNQIPGEPIDVQRQYLVRFIADSSAGFILKGVTLTQATFQRQVYFLGTLFSGLFGVLLRIYL